MVQLMGKLVTILTPVGVPCGQVNLVWTPVVNRMECLNNTRESLEQKLIQTYQPRLHVQYRRHPLTFFTLPSAKISVALYSLVTFPSCDGILFLGSRCIRITFRARFFVQNRYWQSEWFSFISAFHLRISLQSIAFTVRKG